MQMRCGVRAPAAVATRARASADGDSRWWGEPEQPEGGDSMLWHTLSALSLLAAVQHVAHRALVRAPLQVDSPASNALSCARGTPLTAPAPPAQAECEQQGLAAC